MRPFTTEELRSIAHENRKAGENERIAELAECVLMVCEALRQQGVELVHFPVTTAVTDLDWHLEPDEVER